MSIKTLEREQRTNLREIRRLRARLSSGECGRNAGATESALDRRLEADSKLIRKLAEAEVAEEATSAPAMEVVTDSDGPEGWVVKAEWFGEMRVVHRGDVFSCARFRAEQERGE